MKKGMMLGFLGLAFVAISGNANDLVPVAVSPGQTNGVAVVRQSCPTFSWTSVSWALTYNVVVFEAAGQDLPAYEKISAQTSPVLSKDVPGKALSWTPSVAEQLMNGESYIWYVGAMVSATQGRWSEGRRFTVAEGLVWSEETKKRVAKTLQDSGVSEDVSKKVLQEMNGGIAGGIVDSLDLTGGSQSGVQGSEGTYNTLYGKYAGSLITTGQYDSFFGRSSGYANTSGFKNTFVGYCTGRYNATASEGTFLGYAAGYKNATGNYDTFVGSSAGCSNTTGYNNVFLGSSAGYFNKTGCVNTFIGGFAGYSNTTGKNNTFLGASAGFLNTTGGSNTFLGVLAGYANTTGYANTFLGNLSGRANTTGHSNTFLGQDAGASNTDGIENTYVGNGAGKSNALGIYNTLIGTYAGSNNTNGYYNSFIGYKAGYANTIGTCNVFLGFKAGYYETGSEKLYIANSDTASPLIYGDFHSTILKFNGKVGIQRSPEHLLHVGVSGAYCDGGAWVDGSSREFKENIEALTSTEALRAFEEIEPVKFNYKQDKEEQYLGFIAEDVPDLVAMKDRKGLNPMDIVAMLTKVVQEQQKAISELKEKISKLENRSLKEN